MNNTELRKLYKTRLRKKNLRDSPGLFGLQIRTIRVIQNYHKSDHIKNYKETI